jgi:hypothetical protein
MDRYGEPPCEGSASGWLEAPLYAVVAERLKEAHARVHALNVSDETRAALVRRLLAVTESAKRDLPAAARRLSRIVTDLDAGRLPPPPAL